MNSEMQSIDEYYDVIVVGAGPAGLGVGVLLEKLGINYVILEKDFVGSSFRKWPQETKFISPSFTGNFFQMPDLNAITPATSPAFDLLTEHPNGNEYADYLVLLSKHFQLHIQINVEVKNIDDKGDSFIVNTTNGTFGSAFVIWAAGEFQYPKKDAFEGAELCLHYADVVSFATIPADEVLVVGAYESGFDAALSLANLGKKVTLIDNSQYMELVKSDSSYSLSPYTRDRIRDVLEDVAYHEETRVEKVEFVNNEYVITAANGKTFSSVEKPINCTGFDTSLRLVSDLFDFEEGYPLLTNFDESRRTKNFFLVGPQVKHGTALFCFIYKYRQRFALVAETIAKKMKIPRRKIENVLMEYKTNNFYLKDLDCCDDECVC